MRSLWCSVMSKRSIARTLGLDPGTGLTGWSDGRFSGQLPPNDLLEWLNTNLRRYDRVAIERFVTRKLTPDSEGTLELIGAIKMLCELNSVSYGMVNASARSRTVSEVSDQIKGKHARDAEAVRLWDLKYGEW